MSRSHVILPRTGGGLYRLEPEKVIAVGLNYREHIAESVTAAARGDQEVPEEPVLFAKTANTLVGDGVPIRLPGILSRYRFSDERTDYEAELAVVIADDFADVAPSHVLAHVLGYTCANDVSQRNIQRADRSGWFRGKSFDTFCPVGPVLVDRDQIADPNALSIVCRLNGTVVQSATTADMVFSVPELISFISRNMTLRAGDLILTGTPAGVGPLSPGDRVEVEVEGIGVLSNPVVAGDVIPGEAAG
jgi:2-keto-4-pentenoate hydratase/2-oxohepta-3-ene-1,7-dioic acid hydratase in catechol pathway